MKPYVKLGSGKGFSTWTWTDDKPPRKMRTTFSKSARQAAKKQIKNYLNNIER
jgi:hypothetical protein